MNGVSLPAACRDTHRSVGADLRPVPGVSATFAAADRPVDAALRSPEAAFLANGPCRVSYLVHRALQVCLRSAERLRPVLPLEILAHVDLAAIGLLSLGEVVHPVSL